MSERRERIIGECILLGLLFLAFLAGYFIGHGKAVGRRAPAPLPTPPAEAGAENHPRADDRSASSARRGFLLPHALEQGANLPTGAVVSGGRIESESVDAAVVGRTAAGRESNFQNL